MMNKINGKILDEIMQLMDEKDGEKLMKHPKLVAMKVTAAKPIDKVEAKEEIKEMADEEMGEELDEDTIMELLKSLKK